jgi:hypothetical protein
MHQQVQPKRLLMGKVEQFTYSNNISIELVADISNVLKDFPMGLALDPIHFGEQFQGK